MYGIPGYGRPRRNWYNVIGAVCAAIFILLAVAAWVFIQADSLDDCVRRGHTVGWCMSSHRIDTGR